jgi:hypothetical protein
LYPGEGLLDTSDVCILPAKTNRKSKRSGFDTPGLRRRSSNGPIPVHKPIFIKDPATEVRADRERETRGGTENSDEERGHESTSDPNRHFHANIFVNIMSYRQLYASPGRASVPLSSEHPKSHLHRAFKFTTCSWIS